MTNISTHTQHGSPVTAGVSRSRSDDDDLITEIEAAGMRCQSVRTLQMERLTGINSCSFIKLGRSVRYRRGDVRDYIATRRVRSTTEADAKAAAANV